MDSFINARFLGRPTEQVSDYLEYWHWGENCQPEGLRRIQFLRYTRHAAGSPLAIFELEEPIIFRDIKSGFALAGTKNPPETVRRVYRWPLGVTWWIPNREEHLLDECIQRGDIECLGLDYIEPMSFDGSPHFNLRATGTLNEDLWDAQPPEELPGMVRLLDGPWWEKLEIDETTRYVYKDGKLVPAKE